jgi:hypothetical protein
MLRRVVLVRTDVPEEPSVSIIKVTRIGVLTRDIRPNIPEDSILHLNIIRPLSFGLLSGLFLCDFPTNNL